MHRSCCSMVLFRPVGPRRSRLFSLPSTNSATNGLTDRGRPLPRLGTRSLLPRGDSTAQGPHPAWHCLAVLVV